LKNKIIILLILLFVVGFLIRTFPIRTSFHYWDETVYLQHAEIIIGNIPEENFNEFHLRPPLIPILFALGYMLYHSVITSHMIVSLIASLGIIAVFLLARAMFKDERLAILASFIYTLNPLHIWLAHDLLVDAMLPTFLTFTILSAYIATKTENNRYYIISGLFLGLSILLKFTSLSFFPLILIILFLFSRHKTRNRYSFEYLLYILKSKNLWILLASCLIVLIPYFIYVQLKFGFFLQTFVNGYMIVNSDTPTDPYLFFTHFFEIFPPIFLFGILLLTIPFIKRGIPSEELMLITLVLISFLLLQTLVHKEMRFLLLILPFLSILSARGFFSIHSFIKNKNNKILITTVMCVAIVFSSYLMIEDIWQIKSIVSMDLFIDDWEPSVMKAALWIKNNTPSDTIIYNNYQYPPIAYYSERKVLLLPFNDVHGNIDKIMQQPGYVVVSSMAPPDREPNAEFLLNDNRFVLLETFVDQDETIYIFGYK